MSDWGDSFLNLFISDDDFDIQNDDDIIYDDFYYENHISNEGLSSALVTKGNTFDNEVTSLVFREPIEYGYEIDSIKFEGLFDQKIIYICSLMFNKEKNRPHNYKNMSDFLKDCINFTNKILELIETLSVLISEDSNYFMHHGLKDTIVSYFKEFKCNCESNNFFHVNQKNADLLNDLYDTLLTYLSEKNYLEDDFNNTDFLYSNVQLTWSIIKINLVQYQNLLFKKYQQIMFNPVKTIAWYNFPARLLNYFYPQTIVGTVVVNQTTPQIQYPIIQNRISYNRSEFRNTDQKMIASY